MDPIYAVQGALQLRGLTDAPSLPAVPDLRGGDTRRNGAGCSCGCHAHETPVQEFDYGQPFPEELR